MAKKKVEVTKPKITWYHDGVKNRTELFILNENQWMQGACKRDQWKGPAAVIRRSEPSGGVTDTHTWVDDDMVWKWIAKLLKSNPIPLEDHKEFGGTV